MFSFVRDEVDHPLPGKSEVPVQPAAAWESATNVWYHIEVIADAGNFLQYFRKYAGINNVISMRTIQTPFRTMTVSNLSGEHIPHRVIMATILSDSDPPAPTEQK